MIDDIQVLSIRSINLKNSKKKWYTKYFIELPLEKKKLMRNHWDVMDQLQCRNRFLDERYIDELLKEANRITGD